MFCPFCANEKTQVVATMKGLTNVRIRRCPECKKLFQTTECVSVSEKDTQILKEFYEASKDDRDKRA